MFGSVELLAQSSAGLLSQTTYVAVPPLTTRVTDTTATLNMSEVAALEQKIRTLEQQTGGQLAVLLVPTTQPETIDQYALRVAEQWKIGRKGNDNGAIIVLAMQDKKVRIEVGYGWEGALPDVYAKRIISDVMNPYFKQGQFGSGLAAGLDKIALSLNKDPAVNAAGEAWQKSHTTGTADEVGDGLMSMAPMLLGMFAILSFMLPSLLVGLVGGVGTFMFTGSVPTAAVVGIAGFVFAGILKALFGGLRNNLGANNGMQTVRRSGGVGPGIWFPSGGGFGGGGGGSMPDIFSGGGGGFGGGGASGGWGDGD